MVSSFNEKCMFSFCLFVLTCALSCQSPQERIKISLWSVALLLYYSCTNSFTSIADYVLSWECPTFLALFCFFCVHPVQHSGCITGNVFSERYDDCQSWYSVDLRRNKSRLDACDAPICAEVVCVQLAAFICNSHWEVMEQRLSVSHCRCVFIDDQMNGAKGCENTIRI